MEYWKIVDKNGNSTAVEGHSFSHKVPDGVKITKEEFDAYIASLPVVPPLPIRGLATALAEIDELKVKVEKLEREVTPSEMAA